MLTSEFSDQQILLQIASNLIVIFCATMLGENVPGMFTFQSCCGRCFCYTGHVDFEMRCLQEDLSWRAYADDICLIGDNHNELEIGLSFNVNKCEGMFLNFTN